MQRDRIATEKRQKIHQRAFAYASHASCARRRASQHRRNTPDTCAEWLVFWPWPRYRSSPQRLRLGQHMRASGSRWRTLLDEIRARRFRAAPGSGYLLLPPHPSAELNVSVLSDGCVTRMPLSWTHETRVKRSWRGGTSTKGTLRVLGARARPWAWETACPMWLAFGCRPKFSDRSWNVDTSGGNSRSRELQLPNATDVMACCDQSR
jgi:hypothetical protein